MLKMLFGGSHSAANVAVDPEVRKKELESYRQFIETISRPTERGDVALVRRVDSAAIVVSALLRVGRERVVIFGKTLPEETFLSPVVRAAMIGFFERSPTGRITIITNEPTYRERLLAFEDHVLDGTRLDVFSVPEEAVKGLGTFMVSDTPVASVMYFQDQIPGEGWVQFSCPELGLKLQRIAESFIAEFGSIP